MEHLICTRCGERATSFYLCDICRLIHENAIIKAFEEQLHKQLKENKNDSSRNR